MLLLRLAMIQMEPVMTRKTISTPKASARILFVLSEPLPRCRKKTRWIPICAMASTIKPTGMPGAQSKLVCDTTNEAIVARIASTRPRCTTGSWPWAHALRHRASGPRTNDRSLGCSHQIDQREYPDPDDIQRMPEQ